MADRFVVQSMYEIKTPSPSSNKVAIRFSSKINWKNKPWVGTSLITGHFEDVMRENFEFLKKWAPDKIAKMR